MADNREIRRRPGGRTAKVAAAVYEAVWALSAEAGAGGFTVAEVAARADVNPASIYRRWRSLEAVILDAETARLSEISPVPDTGTLSGDLLAYARAAVIDIARPGGLLFLQALIRARDLDDEQRLAPLLQRAGQLQAMLDRGRDRGEPALDHTAVVDCILAPIYMRTLTGRTLDDSTLQTFVERTLASMPQATTER